MVFGTEAGPKQMLTPVAFGIFVELFAFGCCYGCIKDYDSPRLNIITTKPQNLAGNRSGNITLTCVVRPFESGYLVRHSSFTVRRSSNHMQIAKVDKFDLVEGSYNLTISLRSEMFANETSLSAACYGSTLSHTCTNITETILLVGSGSSTASPVSFPKYNHSTLRNSYTIAALLIGSFSVGLAIALAFCWKWKRRMKMQSHNMSSVLLEAEQHETADTYFQES